MKKHMLSILITEDEEGMRQGIERALARFVARFDDLDAEVSYEIDQAASGEEALEKIEKKGYDILLLDYKLPGVDGLEVLRRVREKGLDTITIMITAYASIETAITATKQGAFDFLAKPFTPQEVRAAVRQSTSQLLLMREAKRLAEEKKQIRFEFINVLSHELKSPLNAVESYLNLMKDGTVMSDPAALNHAIERSLVRIRGMRKLIHDLIDMTRIESGTRQRNVVPTDLVELAKNSIEAHEPLAKERNVTVELVADRPVIHNVDRLEMEIAFNNLISNAIKYNKQGGKVYVRIWKEPAGLPDDAGDRAVIEVEDTGIGMTEKEQARLFGEFVRIKNEKTRNIEGSGLGLSTLKKIIALHGGEVKVSSVPDKGSIFTCILNSTAQPGSRSEAERSGFIDKSSGQKENET